MTSSDIQARVREERATVNQNAEKLPVDQLRRWEACKSNHRFAAFHGKEIVAYKLLFLAPEVVNTFTCKGLDVSLAAGLSSLWEDREGKPFWVGSRPVEVAPNCFFWMLKYSTLEYMNRPEGKKSLRFSMCYGTLKNPSDRSDGTFYLLEQGVFRNTVFEQDQE